MLPVVATVRRNTPGGAGRVAAPESTGAVVATPLMTTSSRRSDAERSLTSSAPLFRLDGGVGPLYRYAQLGRPRGPRCSNRRPPES